MSKQDFRDSRRSFFKQAAASAATVFILPMLQKGSSVFAADLKPLSESDPVAASMGYHIDASKVDPKKWSKRSGPTAKEQTCSTCIFYSGDKKQGKCQIFPNNVVAAQGWCNTWNKKP